MADALTVAAKTARVQGGGGCCGTMLTLPSDTPPALRLLMAAADGCGSHPIPPSDTPPFGHAPFLTRPLLPMPSDSLPSDAAV